MNVTQAELLKESVDKIDRWILFDVNKEMVPTVENSDWEIFYCWSLFEDKVGGNSNRVLNRWVSAGIFFFHFFSSLTSLFIRI